MNTTPTNKGYPHRENTGKGIPMKAQKQPKLGDLLRHARVEAGLQIREASKESGVSIGSLSSLEQGKFRSTSPDRLVALAEAYGVEPTGFLEAAGYNLAPTLPTLTPYLRTKYRHLPEEARDEIATAFQKIAAKYGVDTAGGGPSPGQDEETSPHKE